MISAVIITLNEAHNICACIDSLGDLCNEVIVVDSGSSDKTAALAQSLGARVYQQAYLGDGPQKNHGLQFTKNDWILSLDADERLMPEAVECIKRIDLQNTPYDAFSLRRRNYIGSRWIKVCGWYPDHFVRLYNKTRTRFSEAKGHSQVTTANFERLPCDLIHYSYKSVGELFSKSDRFSTRGAKILHGNGRRANSFSPVMHGTTAFIRKFFFQKGFLGGVDGATVALSAGVNSYLKYAKLLEIQRDPLIQKGLDEKGLWSL